MKTKILAGALLVLAMNAGLFAAFAPGGDAYTKRVDTALLSEPRMLAKPVARLPYGRKLRIEAIEGAWLQVSDGKKWGWVFGGNLAAQKPSEVKGLDGLPVAASPTSASTAARPLAPVAVEYSQRRGLSDAAGHLNWLEREYAAITAADVEEFLRAKKKGEHQ